MVRKITRFSRKLKWLFGIYLMPKHIATVETKNGILSFNSRDRTLGRSLSIEREFESEMMQRCVSLLTSQGFIKNSQQKTVMDVGGYVGMSGIGFLNFGLFQKALIFEPNPNSFALINKNIKQNSFSNQISVFNLALSNAVSELTMELSHKNFGDHRIRQKGNVEKGHYAEEKRKIISVKSTTLDIFVDENRQIDFDNVAIVWMDIQGHEGKFLQGAYQFLLKQKVPVIMEFWPYGLLRSGTTRDEFLDLIKQLFTHFYIIDKDDSELKDITQVELLFDDCVKTASGGYNLAFVNQS